MDKKEGELLVHPQLLSYAFTNSFSGFSPSKGFAVSNINLNPEIKTNIPTATIPKMYQINVDFA